MRRAIVLAGGKGTRLRPYTIVLPKPLVPLGEEPILEVIVKQLAKSGFTRITMAVNHQAEIIKAFFGDGRRWGVEIDYALESAPLGTMGPLRNVRDLPEDFLVMNGDVLTDLDFAELFESHVLERRPFTISAATRVEKIDYGVLRVDGASTLSGFEEKPTTTYLVSMGIYVVNRRVVGEIPEGRAFGFDDLMHALLRGSECVGVAIHKGLWLDIGRPSDYEKAIELFNSERSAFLA